MAVDVKAHLDDLSVRLDRLRILYEQYFMGIEKMAPTVARREVDKLFDFLGRQNIGNTAIRFRYLGLLRKGKTYAERWDKILREIENGTYAPHRMRVERAKQSESDRLAARAAVVREKLAAAEALRGAGDAAGSGEGEGAAGDEAVPEALSPTSSGRMVAVARPSAIPGMSEPDLRDRSVQKYGINHLRRCQSRYPLSK